VKGISVKVGSDSSKPYTPWEVYYYSEGRRVRVARVKTKKEAQATAIATQNQINTQGADALPVLTPAEIREYVAAKKSLGATSLARAVEFYLEANNRSSSILLATAVERFLEAWRQTGLSDGTMANYEQRLRALTLAFPKTALSFFEQAQADKEHPLQQFIGQVSGDPQTQRHYRTNIGTFFKFCVTRVWIRLNPIVFVPAPKVVRGEPEIYNVEEFDKLLGVFEEHHPEFLPYLALQSFAALRPSEAARQPIADIYFEEKSLRVHFKKKGQPGTQIRLIENPPDILWKWLAPLKGKEGTIFHQDFPQKMRRIVGAVGLKWKFDGLRHSCLTYYSKLHGHDKAAELAGHQAGSYTLSKHYKAVVARAAAGRYFDRAPGVRLYVGPG
jgi:integrase